MAGQNASLQYWKNADGAVSQALYRSADETVSVRTFYDETTGLPRRILDELSGNWLLIQENGADSVDFWSYDLVGSYQSGFAVFEDAGQYDVGEIAGLPIHAGKQIIGELVSATSSWIGSFTLDVDTGDLKTRQPVAADIAALMDDLAPDDTLVSGLSVGGMVLLGLVDDSSGDANAPADTAAFEALAGGKVVVFTYADSDHMASVEFLSAGRFVWTDQNDLQPGNFGYVNTGPDTGTLTLTLDPDNDPDEYEHVFEVTFTSGTSGAYESTYTEGGQEPVVTSGHFKIVDWAVPDGIATAGAAAFVTSLFVPDVTAGNRDKCTRLRNPVSRDVCRLSADFLAHGVEGGPTGLVRDGVDWARDKPGYLGDRIDRGKGALENVAGELLPDDAIHARRDTETLAWEPPPPIGSRVSGEASGPDGITALVEGDISLDGDFTVTGDDSRGLPVVVKGAAGDDDTADSGEVALTPNWAGTSSLRAAMGNVVVAGDTTGDSAAFEWGSDSGSVRSVRSTVVLHGDAPVVVRKILFVQAPKDGRAVTLGLSEFFSDPNGDPMRFTAVSNLQEHIDVRVSGSTLSMRQITPNLNFISRIRVTATDPGGLTAEMSFHIKTFSPPAVLWTTSYNLSKPYKIYTECAKDVQCANYIGHSCSEYVILDSDAYERQRLRSGGQIPPRDNLFPLIYLPSIDRRFGELECSGSSCAWSDGLNCPNSFVTEGGCRQVFNWGTYTTFSRYHVEVRQDVQRQSSEHCWKHGFRWATRRSRSTSNLLLRIRSWARDLIIKYYDVPVRPGNQPRREGPPRA